jgi:hypothetical protein
MSETNTGNFIFIVCLPCREAKEFDYGFRLAERGLIGYYHVFGPALATKNLEAWVQKHSGCAGKGYPDHFGFAYLNCANSDQPKPKELKAAVKLALVQ